MKKKGIVISITLCILICIITLIVVWQKNINDNKASNSNDNGQLLGYIRDIDSEYIYMDLIEDFIGLNDTERIKELGIADKMPSGFYIYNPDDTVSRFSLSKATEYTFIDWNFEYSKNGDKSDAHMNMYSTKDISIFKQCLKDYRLLVPFYIELDGDKLLKIREKYMP